MKIRKIGFENHPVLENLELDFTDSDGRTLDTIIIAGENGVGKSVLLNAIFEFSNIGVNSVKRNQRNFLEIEFSQKEIDIFRETESSSEYFQKPLNGNILNLTIDYNIVGRWDQYSFVGKTVDGELVKPHGSLLADQNNRNVVKIIFSDVEINFTPKNIQNVTSSNVDRIDVQSQKSNANLASEITQLLIDIQTIDAHELNNWVKQNIGIPVHPDKVDVRMKRFTSAFEFMFPNKKYIRIDTVENQKKLIFSENGREMDIDSLSSGEKQIVFRGGFFLKDKESSKGAIVLVDEPEISLHPNWQLKILSYFKKILTDNHGNQSSQLFIATHSPFVIHNYNRNDDKVIVLHKDDRGKIYVSQEPKFYSWSPEKIVQDAFNVSHILKKDKVMVFLEGETDERYFKKCAEIYGHHEKNIEFRWIGRNNELGQAEYSGDTALNHTRTYFLANMDLMPNKAVLLYDSDTKKKDESTGDLFIRCMKTNKENMIYKIGVENLLSLPDRFNKDEFYRQKIKEDGYGAKSTITELDKTRLCEAICEKTPVAEQKVILMKVNDEIERIIFEIVSPKQTVGAADAVLTLKNEFDRT